MNDIEFRLATLDDLPVLVELRLLFLAEFMRREPDEQTEVLRRNLTEYFRQALPDGSYVSVLAKFNGEPVACGGMVVWRVPPGYRMMQGRKGYILCMYTRPSFRKRGIGKRIIELLLSEAERLDLNEVHLHAASDGIRIYRQAGFIEPYEPELVQYMKGSGQ